MNCRSIHEQRIGDFSESPRDQSGILEDDQLVEVFFQRANEYSLAGSIHKGRVTRVLPGMQSAFVDLGLERDTFLYVSDFFEEDEDFDRVSVSREPSRRDVGAQSTGREPPVAARPGADRTRPRLRRSRRDAKHRGAAGSAEAAAVAAPAERPSAESVPIAGTKATVRRSRPPFPPPPQTAAVDSRIRSTPPKSRRLAPAALP